MALIAAHGRIRWTSRRMGGEAPAPRLLTQGKHRCSLHSRYRTSFALKLRVTRCSCPLQDAISRGVPVPCPPGELYLTAPSLLDALDPSLVIQQLQRNGEGGMHAQNRVHVCMRGRGAPRHTCLHESCCERQKNGASILDTG